MPASADATFHELLADFSVAMLVTRTAGGDLRSRPMALAQIEPAGTLWFLTERDSEKMDEIARDNRVNISMQADSKFVSVSGTVAAVEDRAKIDELWSETFKVWFPRGKDDPDLQLIRFDGTTGEYWDNSGLSGIKYLIEAGKAYLTGKRPDVENDPKVHAKVKVAQATRP